MKAPEGREAFLRLVERADVVIESFRPGVVDRLGIGWEATSARNPRARVLLDQRLRADRPPLPVGRATTSTTSASAASSHCTGRAADGQPPVPGATVADSAGGGMHAVMAILAALVRRAHHRRGRVPRRVDRRRRPRAHGPRRSTSTSPPARSPGPGTACSPVATRATTRTRRATATGSRSPPSSRGSGPTCASCSASSSGRQHQHDDAVQDQIRADLRAVFLTRDRDEWTTRLSASRHVRRAGADRRRVVDRRAVRGPRRLRRRARTTSTARSGRSGPVFAGMARPTEPVRGTRRDRHRHRRAARPRAGLSADELAKLHEAGVIVRVHPPPRTDAAGRGRRS